MYKNIFAYSFLFLLLYFEYIHIGFIKLSHLWKIVLFIYLLTIVFKYKLPYPLQKFLFLGFIISISIFFHANSFKNISGDITFFLDLISIPLFLSFFSICLFYKKYLNLEMFILNISVFIILSNLPFLLGILEPKETMEVGYDDVRQLTQVFGIFNNASGASKLFTLSSLIVFAHKRKFFENGAIHKAFWIALCIIGFFSVIYSFARTGWILYFLGLLILSFYKSSFRMKLFAFFLSIIIIPILISIFTTNEQLYNRLIGKKENKEYVYGDYNRVSSGRIDLFKYSIKIFQELSPLEKFVGIGTEGALEGMRRRTGNRTFSHNRFLEILLVGGCFVFLLYIIYLKYLIRFAGTRFKRGQDLKARLSTTLLILFLISLVPSHGFGFYGNILFTAIIVINQKNKYENIC